MINDFLCLDGAFRWPLCNRWPSKNDTQNYNFRRRQPELCIKSSQANGKWISLTPFWTPLTHLRFLRERLAKSSISRCLNRLTRNWALMLSKRTCFLARKTSRSIGLPGSFSGIPPCATFYDESDPLQVINGDVKNEIVFSFVSSKGTFRSRLDECTSLLREIFSDKNIFSVK